VSNTNDPQHILGAIEFEDNLALRRFLEQARRAFHVLAVELTMAAHDLEAALSTVPTVHGLGGLDSRMRAKRVARNVHFAAEVVGMASLAMTRTHAAFRKHFERELDEAGGKGTRAKPKFTVRAE
jgi:hypothetical protein